MAIQTSSEEILGTLRTQEQRNPETKHPLSGDPDALHIHLLGRVLANFHRLGAARAEERACRELAQRAG